ncbi:MAG TPA: STAS domain-containing protein [Pseudolabrys sp.]|jgi:anti-anti-sigma factor|nr:STAS domain-containing protein [Pseudolabrys sp.]
MDVIEQEAGNVTIVEPRGRIDSVTAKEFGDRLASLLSVGRHRLVIDLKSISYISSAGFRQLLIANKSTQEKNGKLALCGIVGEVKRLFEIGAFDDLFSICATREDGIASVQ